MEVGEEGTRSETESAEIEGGENDHLPRLLPIAHLLLGKRSSLDVSRHSLSSRPIEAAIAGQAVQVRMESLPRTEGRG
ncbi:MAG: hypothetical protein ACE5JL_13755 [Dehalococcoidia bacterium]